MRVTEGADHIRAIDASRRTATLRFRRWEPADGGGYLFEDENTGYEPDERRNVLTTRIETEPVPATVIHTDDGERERVGRGDRVYVNESDLVVLRTPVLVLLRTETMGYVRYGIDKTVFSVHATDPTTIGFRSRTDYAEGTIRTEQSPEGVADAITALNSAIDVTSPDRTWPNVRRQPPTIEFNDNTNTDEFVAEAPEVDTTLELPEENALDYLFPTATLAHYTGATVELTETDTARLHAADETFSIASDPESVDKIASQWLRRVFYLDSHARSAGPYGTELAGHDALDELGLDAGELYDQPLAKRVSRYISLPEDTIAELPEWHLGVHIDPQISNVSSLSHHLGRLADLYVPDGKVLETAGERLEWGEQQRVRGAVQTEPTVVVDPEQRAATVGWQASQRAVNAFNWVADPNRSHDLTDELSVTVVRASGSMDAVNVVDRYETVTDDRPLSVEFVGDPTAAELARLFESDNDLVHYVGHHEPDGLRCRDGHVNGFSVDTVRTQAFFLNACGSYRTGERLVERGAAAGAVTTRDVADETATRVGTDWAGLMSLGWSVERALDFARRPVDPAGYTTVGDGTHVLTEADTIVPLEATERDDGQLRLDRSAPREAGFRVSPEIGSPRLHTNGFAVDPSEKQEEYEHLMDVMDNPVLRSGELDWF